MKTTTLKTFFLSAALAILGCATLHAEVTWTGVDTTWNQPDTDSFSATYNDGLNVIFGNTGVGAVTVGAGVTPGTVTFNHSSGTYVFSGSSWNAGTNAMNLSGGGTVQIGNLSNSAIIPSWGATNISGGSSLYLTRATNIGGSAANLITLDNGTLMNTSDNSSPFSSGNTIQINAGGGTLWGRSAGTNYTRIDFSGPIQGSGPLLLASSTNSTGSLWRGFGLVLSGNNSAFTGAVTIVSYNGGTSNRATVMGQFGSAFTTVANDAALFANASSITVRDGGNVAASFAAEKSFFDRLTIGPRGGIGATGASGTLTSLSSPMDYVGVGGVLVLDNQNALNNDRIADTAALALNNNRLHIIGRSASTNPTNEIAGAMTFAGSSLFSIDRPNSSNSGVKLTVASLGNASAGNTLLIQADTWGTTAELNNLLVTGAKPAVTNGMITPGIQQYTSGNNLGNFLTFAGDNLVAASYAGFAGDWSAALSTDIVNLTAAATLGESGDMNVHALRVSASGTHNLGGRTVNLGSGGFITTSATTSNGTLNFGSGPGFIGAYNGASQANISAGLAGSGGLTVLGTTQSLNLSGTNTGLTGGIFVNGGTVSVTTAAANANNVTVGAFGRLTGPNSNSTAVLGGLSGDGRVSAFFQGNSGNNNTLELTPASGTHTFEGQVRNGDAGRILHLSKSGAGTQVFGENSQAFHSGSNTVSQGSLLVHGDFSAAAGAFSVADGATFGGNGRIGGDLNLASGALLAFDPTWTLTVNGDVTLDSSFGVASLSGLTSSVGVGYYTLIDGTATDFASLGIQNFGVDNAVSIGGGKSAYFTEGSLVLNVIPEPGTLLLVGIALGSLLLFRRRR